MSNSVPDGWGVRPLSELAAIDKESLRSSTDPNYEFRYIDIASVKTGKVDVPSERVCFQDSPSRARKVVRKGDVLMSTVRPNLQAFAYFDEEGDDYVASTGFAVIKANNHSAGRFLYQSILSDSITRQVAALVAGSNYPAISSSNVKELELLVPPLPEQQKIAAILSSVDDVIEKTRAQIDKLKDLKTGMMQELLTKGIGHTAFKDSPVGRIPEGWNVVPYSDVVKVVMPSIKLSDSEQYCPVVVRRRHMGVETRGSKEGSRILVKSQFQVVPGTFLISRRQIFHGSCGLVPLNIDKRAIISKEYLALEATSELDIRFLDYFSHSEEFHQQIIRTTYGVDVEKFVFKDKWWMKELIPLPPVQEQKEICEILDSIAERIETGEKHLNQCLSIKKALMQDLLTGKIRVNVDNKENAVA